MGRKLKQRVGETNNNFYGNKMTIIEYNSSQDIVVKFENGYTTRSMYKEFLNGHVSNPYDKRLFNVGYLGEGNYCCSIDGKITNQYTCWSGIIKRCYDKEYSKRFPTYKDCTVCDEWHNYQNFAKWYDENYYEVKGYKMHLDKDILVKGNKIYSPDTCVFTPDIINTLFVKKDANRGEYPIGVYIDKNKKKYIAQYNKNKRIHIGKFSTPEEAFYKGYKPYKEQYIKEVADKYKDKIPKKLHEALYRYEVAITD